MTLENDIMKLSDNEKRSPVHMYTRPVFILLCCIIGFVAFRMIIIDKIMDRDLIDIYTARNKMEEGNFKEAKEILDQVLDKEPNYSLANRRLGFLYLQQDELEKALACYQKALKYSTDREEIESTIGLIKKRMEGNYEQK